jgi:short-subunit dehydrogenase
LQKKFAVEGANLMLISDNIDKLNENVLIYKDRYEVSVDYMINTLDDEADVKDWLSSIVDAYG